MLVREHFRFCNSTEDMWTFRDDLVDRRGWRRQRMMRGLRRGSHLLAEAWGPQSGDDLDIHIFIYKHRCRFNYAEWKVSARVTFDAGRPEDDCCCCWRGFPIHRWPWCHPTLSRQNMLAMTLVDTSLKKLTNIFKNIATWHIQCSAVQSTLVLNQRNAYYSQKFKHIMMCGSS